MEPRRVTIVGAPWAPGIACDLRLLLQMERERISAAQGSAGQETLRELQELRRVFEASTPTRQQRRAAARAAAKAAQAAAKAARRGR